MGDAARRCDAAGDEAAAREAYQYLHDVCVAESEYALQVAAADEIGSGGDSAWRALRARFAADEQLTVIWSQWNAKLRPSHDGYRENGGRRAPWAQRSPGALLQRQYKIQAWLLPLLLGSACKERAELDGWLADWIHHVGSGNDDGRMPLSIEAALAQGFRRAANRRPHHSHENAEARRVLQKHARTMICNARFWYTRLSLLHALCLWEVARLVYPGHSGHEAPERAQDPHAVIAGWLRRTGPKGTEEEQHRFVQEAADLAQRALETRQPERFVWMDEVRVVTTVGAPATKQDNSATKPLWITPSAGWTTLDRRAQQLAADVLILLNLAERDADAEQREQGLHRANAGELPKCITSERSKHLQPSLTAGMADIPNPGQTCKAHCHVGLCPYPPRGGRPYRAELSEAFCRNQLVAIRRLSPHRHAPWQQTAHVELRRFWREMERRARI